MSRVGKQPIEVPSGTKVAIEDGWFVAEGPKGKVSERVLDGIAVEIDGATVKVTRADDSRDLRARHGLVRALLANAREIRRLADRTRQKGATIVPLKIGRAHV